MDLDAQFGCSAPLIGMVHLPALPGAPRFQGDRSAIRGRALADADAIKDGGFDAFLVENFGDAPFYPDEVPPHVVAEMTAVARELDIGTDLPFGVNVLRNDARSALSIAAASGGSFVRVNVHAGTRLTDQGLLEGRAHETLRLRERIEADVAILADVAVKHSAPVGDVDVATRTVDLIERGLADGLVVSGSATGEPADSAELRTVLDARDDADPEVPVFVGSGVTRETVAEVLDLADGAIVGTALKGETGNRVDPDRVAALAEAARDAETLDTQSGLRRPRVPESMGDETVSETVTALAGEVGPTPDDILVEMDERADDEQFPTVGPTVGGWLALLARMVDARRVFEFGSGFGYSAYWFARALPEDGEVVLTEIDEDELDAAREYFQRGGLAEKAHFEHGDALETVEAYQGPFDVVLIDCQKERYAEALEAIREKLRSGSVVLADNAVTAGPYVHSDEVLGCLQGEDRPDAADGSVGVASYLDEVRTDDAFETALLPLGEGVAVSMYR
ncbi:MAG: membrane complex biogenesis BtpA family protein [Haloarculaceae archaeon]|jgi:membrane complex biogenesis BtpA family protein